MKVLQSSSLSWGRQFLDESALIRQTLEDPLLEIEHIGSTAIPGIAAKPIIDIAVAIPSIENAHQFIEPLSRIGYQYFPESSSQERLFFRKGDPVSFHLSLAQKDKFGYWNRQILFRDYLRAHPEAAHEYEALKFRLLEEDPTGGSVYLAGKSAFIEQVLSR
ncbi:MAG: GrpB family protein [Patescibacteria group bacterium]|jgi:GrpB-like predicted nucleotidyltransferase (UPF0157 family)